jgi:hypothetical protein
MMPQATALLVPATAVPMAPEVRCLFRNDDKVSHANLDDAVTTRAHVALACLIRLDGVHHVLTELAQEFSRAVGELVSRCCHGKQGRQPERES